MPSSSAGRRRASPRSAPPEATPLAVTIARVGHLGDGLGAAPDGTALCVPGTLPGERVLVAPNGRRASITLGRPMEWLQASADRVVPPCPQFGTCGGCALQHWAAAPYLEWKTDLLRQALQGAGYVDPPIAPIVTTAPHERRRIDLAFTRNGRGVTLGLHRARGQDVIDITGCVVLHPAVQALVQPLQSLLAQLPAAGIGGRVAINLLDTGADIVMRAVGTPGTPERALITEFARLHAVARFCWATGTGEPEPICIHQSAAIRFAGVEVAVPPDAFLQAARLAEAAIVSLTTGALSSLKPGPAKLLELYAGCGTLTFALASLGSVAAYEGNLGAVGALRAAANRALPGRITCHHRDLVRQPLGQRELAGFAAVVLDPPWAGAPIQIAEIAKSRIERVVYVSCNPAALRRDAQMLRATGYTVAAATPIDQFLWSAQLESVVAFTR